jgi:hypothetical protein
MIWSEAVENEIKYKLFDYRDHRGRNDIKEWTLGHEKRQRGQLNAKLDQLQRHGEDLGSKILLRMSATVLKLKARTNSVELRPMICAGPIEDDAEFTILIGAKEVQWVLQPVDAVQRAEARREEVIEDSTQRRVPHERVS